MRARAVQACRRTPTQGYPHGTPGGVLGTGSNPAAANNVPAQRQAQPPGPGAQAAPSAPAKEGRLEGTWTTKADNDSTITLTFPGPGRFNWAVANQGKGRQIQGKMTYGNGILTLAQGHGPRNQHQTCGNAMH